MKENEAKAIEDDSLGYSKLKYPSGKETPFYKDHKVTDLQRSASESSFSDVSSENEGIENVEGISPAPHSSQRLLWRETWNRRDTVLSPSPTPGLRGEKLDYGAHRVRGGSPTKHGVLEAKNVNSNTSEEKVQEELPTYKYDVASR